MPNYSQVQSAVPLPSAGLGNATSETQFTTAAVSGGLASGSLLMCRIPASNVLAGRPFSVVVAGTMVTGTTATFTPKLYFGGSSTINSNSAVFAPGASQSLATAKSNFYFECTLYWDSTSKVINGKGSGWGGTTLVAAAATTQVTGVDLSSTEVNMRSVGATDLVFTVTGIFSSGNASNNAFVTVFEVSAF